MPTRLAPASGSTRTAVAAARRSRAGSTGSTGAPDALREGEIDAAETDGQQDREAPYAGGAVQLAVQPEAARARRYRKRRPASRARRGHQLTSPLTPMTSIATPSQPDQLPAFAVAQQQCRMQKEELTEKPGLGVRKGRQRYRIDIDAQPLGAGLPAAPDGDSRTAARPSELPGAI